MDAARRELERMRESPAAWRELGYEAGTDAEGHAYDRNAVARAKVLWALQYDHGPEDLELVRWLADQEAQCRREAAFQGLSEQTELAGFLLAAYGQVADVWRQWAIKRANFDTWCGYDIEYVFAAGVQATVDFVRDSDHADRDDLLGRLLDPEGQPDVSEEDLAQWRLNGREGFPDDPTAEDPHTWIERAKLVGDLELARRELLDWAADRPRDKGTLTALRYQWADLGEFAEAARAQRESLAYADTDWDKASAWQDLAGLERQAGDHDAAWLALGECRRALDGVTDWQSVGLGRHYVQELFLLAGSATGDLAAIVFAEAELQARDFPRLPLVVLQAAVDAAVNAGDQPSAQRFRELRDAERHRVDGNR